LERSSDKYITPNKVLVASVIVAAFGLVVDLVLCWATAWMPNVVVGALTVGLTVTVIDKAMRRAESLRQQPRVDAAMRGINIALHSFLRSAVNGYAGRQIAGPFPDPMPTDFTGWIERLREDLQLVSPRDAQVMLDLGQTLRSAMSEGAAERDVIAPGLVAAITEFGQELDVQAERVQEAILNVVPDSSSQLHEATSMILMDVRDVADAFFLVGKPIPPEMIEDINTFARSYNEKRRAAAE
jgi:hypothetical protein